MLKTYCVQSRTNYDMLVYIINAESKEEAVEIALKEGAWEHCDINEIDIQKPGCVFASSNGY